MVCIVSLFKNETAILKEWLDHYINEGVDTFYLTDNGSTDHYMPILDPYLKTGQVVLNINPKKYAQNKHLNFFLKDAQKHDWVIVIDLDEFIYARRGYKTIKDYLNGVKPDVQKIHVPWKLYGSSGHAKQPKSVIQGFVHRRKYPDDLNHMSAYDSIICKKTIVRGKNVVRLDLHTSMVKDEPVVIFPNNESYNNRDYYMWVTEKLLNESYLHLNHYRIQSVEAFKKKQTRGDAHAKKHNGYRTKKYFKFFDFRDKIDTELKNKKY
jgi:hypothetical protein